MEVLLEKLLKSRFTIIAFVVIVVLISFATTILVNSKLITTSKTFPFFKKSTLCKDCNIILISIDTLRADALPCYGYLRNTAPNLCEFGNNNILFTNASAQASYTLPSHFSIFTSLYPSSHNVLITFKDELHPDIEPLAQVLQKSGYETIYVGLTDHHNLPLDKGIGRGFDIFVTNQQTEGWEIGYKKLLKNAEIGKPTFLFLHSYRVHTPYITNKNSKRLFTPKEYDHIIKSWEEFTQFSPDLFEEALERFESRVQKKEYSKNLEENQKIYESLKKAKTLKEAESAFEKLPELEKFSSYFNTYYDRVDRNDSGQIEYLRALYDEVIFLMDQKLSKLFEILKLPSLSENTIVIITSDHGEEFMEHGNLTHSNNIYNTTTHVPLIMSIPNVGARRVDELAQSIDIYPTVLELMGIELPEWLEGISLADLLQDRPNPKHNDYAISEYRGGVIRSIRDKRWKLYVNNYDFQGGTELYDLAADPLEQNNVVSKNPEVVKKLSEALQISLENRRIFPKIESELPEDLEDAKREKLIREKLIKEGL